MTSHLNNPRFEGIACKYKYSDEMEDRKILLTKDRPMFLNDVENEAKIGDNAAPKRKAVGCS
jgi:hypothetical protein